MNNLLNAMKNNSNYKSYTDLPKSFQHYYPYKPTHNRCILSAKHSSYSKGESVTLAHFKEVWDNGYSVDDYTIDKEGIYFEDASHNGVDPNQISPGTYIMKKQYLRWVKQMKQSKETAVRMLMKNTSLVNRNLEIGDIILYIWKDYVEEEEYRLDNE